MVDAVLDLALRLDAGRQRGLVSALRRCEPTCRALADHLCERAFLHWIYRGDTVLHVLAAAHARELLNRVTGVRDLIHTTNRRGATPLHYAADAVVDAPGHVDRAQAETLRWLIAAGAEVDARDANGATSLRRAIRCRARAAVEVLLAAGASVAAVKRGGVDALALARQATGRGFSGMPRAKANQAAIIALLKARGGRGRSRGS